MKFIMIFIFLLSFQVKGALTKVPQTLLKTTGFCGSMLSPTTASCAWTITDASGGFTVFPEDTDCGTVTATDGVCDVSAPATEIPGILIAAIPAGSTLQCTALGAYQQSTTVVAAEFVFQFYDGTNAFGYGYMRGGGIAGAPINTSIVVGSFKYATAQTNLTVQLRAKSDVSTNDPYLDNATAAEQNAGFKIDCFLF